VPRAPGDTTPIDPTVAEALRKAGIDPRKFTVAPFEAGEVASSFAAMFPEGSRVEHTFAFDTLNGALGAIERIVGDDVAAHINRQETKWVVVFDGPADPNLPAKSVHEQVASRVSDLGGEDRGFSHMTMNVTKKDA
jgi:hypothetical protein